MSITEVTVVLFGLFLGYWVVSNLLGGKHQGKGGKENATGDEQASGTDRQNTEQSSSATWHETLGVPSHATVDEIHSAYRSLISQYHPDKVANLGAELRELADRKSKEITSAYRNAMQLRGTDV